MLVDRAGLTDALSGAMVRAGRWPVHDRGRVLVDVAVLIADGGEAICDIDVLRHQREVFGAVASDTTVWRALDEIDAVRLRRIAAARARVRARVWRLFGGPPAARAAGRDIGERVVVLDVDSTIVLAHSDANTAADHLDVLAQAIAQVPAPHRRHLLIRGDSVAATHAVLDWLTSHPAEGGVLARLVDR